jgi:hypothetical protein
MVMHGHWLSAGLSVPGRIGVIALDAAGESHRRSLQKCKRNHDCDRPANNHQTILGRASRMFNLRADPTTCHLQALGFQLHWSNTRPSVFATPLWQLP